MFSFFFQPHSVAYGIIITQPGLELMPPALETWSLSHWTAREDHFTCFLKTVQMFLPAECVGQSLAEAPVTLQTILSTSQG